MNLNRYVLIATLGSAALLVGAFVSQLLGWAPCKMCLWQRWPHGGAVVAGLAVIWGPVVLRQILIWSGALGALISAGIAGFHSGVELKWWDGPASCSGAGNGLQGLSGAELVPGGSNGPALVMCDTLTPFFLGLTMANWNMIFSAGLVVVWIAASRRTG